MMTPERLAEVERVCAAIEAWAEIRLAQDTGREFRDAWLTAYHLGVKKSCLLDRMVYKGEGLSRTPCPVHEGRWSGIHLWGSREIGGRWYLVGRDTLGMDTVLRPEDPMCAEARAAGCRCFMHHCACTTGWQPDEHCGCGVQP